VLKACQAKLFEFTPKPYSASCSVPFTSFEDNAVTALTNGDEWFDPCKALLDDGTCCGGHVSVLAKHTVCDTVLYRPLVLFEHLRFVGPSAEWSSVMQP
jgi:hypothetical protein